MPFRSHDRLKRDSSHVPITGLALYRSPSGKLFALAGVDTDVVVYDADSDETILTAIEGRVVCRIPVFVDQPVHGIHVGESRGDAGANVLVWGSRTVALFPTGELDETDGGRLRKIPAVATATALDWICDGAVSPFDPNVAILATAHNEVVPLRYSPSTGEISLGAAISLSRPMLFTAGVVWESETSILVAGGTVFGHIIVWRYRLGQDGDRVTEFLFNLQGFEGSIFGVDISSPVALSDGSTVRLLAGCSDDRTIRIWDITERDDVSSLGAMASQLDQDIDTGFGGNSGSTEDIEANQGTENTPAPIAVAMGHASRIWGVKFAPICSANALPVYSFGEDATSQRWLLSLGRKPIESPRYSKSLIGKLSPEKALSLHHGKHLWSNTIFVEGDKMTIATGGADSQINLIEEAVNKDASNKYTHFSTPAVFDVHDILTSITAPKTPAAAKEIISRYDFLTPDQILITTSQGRLLLGSLEHSDGLAWQEIDVDGATSTELKFCYVLKALGNGSALLGTTSGKIYHFQVSGHQISHLVELPGKIFDMSCLYKKNQSDGGSVGVLVYLHGQADSHYLILDPSTGSLHSHKQVKGLDPRFVATSAAMIDDKIIIGSRHGWLSILERHESGIYCPILNLATRSFDTITSIIPLPSKSSNPLDPSPYILATSKDGKYRIYEIEQQAESISLHLRHETSPPFGPVIVGAWFTQSAAPELILYGFRSKSFIIWNETRKEELANIDCGGAHRTFQLVYSELDPGHYRFAFTKTSKLSLHSSNKFSHKSLRRGVHGREVKALSSNGRYIASGAEDTSIRIWEYKSGEECRQAELRCVATMKAHVTGIQGLAWFEDDFFFSSAGNEEFFVWRVQELESSYKGLAVFCEGVFADKSADGDLRIMDFDAVRPNDEDGIIITMGFSNSTLKTYRYTSDNGGFELLAEGSYTGACFTQTRHLSMNEGVLKVLAASTDGHIAIWSAKLSEVRIGNYVLEQGARLHQNSVKSLEMMKVDEGYLVFTGGDDNGVGVTLVEVTSGNTNTHNWKISSCGVVRKAHAAAVTGVALLRRGTEVIGVSVSNDQRVKAWRIASGRERRVGLLGEVCSGVADVGDIALIGYPTRSRATVIVGGVGIETWSLLLD